MNNEQLKNGIRDAIKENGINAITGELLQQVLIAMVNALGTGYQFVGVAAPDADPGTTDNRLCYLAAIPGTYTHFGGIVIEPGETAFLTYGTGWNKITIADSPVIWVDVWDLSHYASLATKIAVFKVLRDAIIQHVNKTVVCFDGGFLFYPFYLYCPDDTQDYVNLSFLANDGIVKSFSMEAEIDEELEITGVDVWYQEDIRFVQNPRDDKANGIYVYSKRSAYSSSWVSNRVQVVNLYNASAEELQKVFSTYMNAGAEECPLIGFYLTQTGDQQVMFPIAVKRTYVDVELQFESHSFNGYMSAIKLTIHSDGTTAIQQKIYQLTAI